MKIKEFMKHINAEGNTTIVIKDMIGSREETITKKDLANRNYHGYENHTFGQITAKNNTMYIYAYNRN